MAFEALPAGGEPGEPPKPDAIEALWGDVKGMGSGRAGSLFIDDAFLPIDPAQIARLMHNAIGRFTGGVRDRVLYEEESLYGSTLEVPLALDLERLDRTGQAAAAPGWVHIPEWGRQVSHDLPFRDGYSGEIAYRLVAESPLLVAGDQQTAGEDKPGVVRPFRLPDGRYAIPGSSLKGMLRAVVEIAGFGRMRMVDDQRPGLRDITGTGAFLAQSYAAKVRNRVRAGFLRQLPDGGQQIIPCKMVRLDHRDLETALDVSTPIFKKRLSVAAKYRHWKGLCRERGWDPEALRFDLQGFEARRLNRGDVSGTPVFIGQISDSRGPGDTS